MQDHDTVHSTDGDEQRHSRLVIAADKADAIKTHREYFRGCKVTGAFENAIAIEPEADATFISSEKS